MILTIPTLKQEGDTILDDLNRQIKFIKGIDILTYYTPTDSNKEQEPLSRPKAAERQTENNQVNKYPKTRSKRKGKEKIQKRPKNHENYEEKTSDIHDSEYKPLEKQND